MTVIVKVLLSNCEKNLCLFAKDFVLFILLGKKMTKQESKLLARWPEHRRRGKVLFVLLRGVVLPIVAILFGVLAYWAISPRHYLSWGGAAFMSLTVAVVNGIRTGMLWDKIESAYVGSQQQQT